MLQSFHLGWSTHNVSYGWQLFYFHNQQKVKQNDKLFLSHLNIVTCSWFQHLLSYLPFHLSILLEKRK